MRQPLHIGDCLNFLSKIFLHHLAGSKLVPLAGIETKGALKGRPD